MLLFFGGFLVYGLFPLVHASHLGFYPQLGAEVRGKVDGAFDSGFLMTATVNGKIFRGVLFAPVSSMFLIMELSNLFCSTIPYYHFI